MANRNWPNSRIYTPHVMPCLIDCNFVVDSTNANGLGIRNLKGGYVASAFGRTTATPAAGNPNPEAGVFLITLQDKFFRYFGGFAGAIAPLTGAALTATTAGVPAVITSLGTATAAQWVAVGVPAGVVPTVGLGFVPSASATIGGSATVSAVGVSGIDHVEIVGDPNVAVAIGAPIVVQTLVASTLTAPANGTVIGLSFYLSNSSVLLQGE